MSTKQQLVRFKNGKTVFEVATKPGTALKYRNGLLGWDNVLVADMVFTKFSKGERAKGADLKAAFGTDDVMECCKTIVDKGELQLSTAERKEAVDKRQREILNEIHKYYVNPKTNKPHPLTRLEAAFGQVRVIPNPDLPLGKQVNETLKKFVGILSLKKVEMGAVLTIPHSYVGQCYNVVQGLCRVGKEEYVEDGCKMSVSFLPGDYDALLSGLNKITKGDYNLAVDGLAGTKAISRTTTEGEAEEEGVAKPLSKKPLTKKQRRKQEQLKGRRAVNGVS